MPVEPSVPGRVRCMTCGTTFRSPDRLRIRRCQRCKKKDGELSARERGATDAGWVVPLRAITWRD